MLALYIQVFIFRYVVIIIRENDPINLKRAKKKSMGMLSEKKGKGEKIYNYILIKIKYWDKKKLSI